MDFVARDSSLEVGENLLSCSDPDIGTDEPRFQLLQQAVIDLATAYEVAYFTSQRRATAIESSA